MKAYDTHEHLMFVDVTEVDEKAMTSYVYRRR